MGASLSLSISESSLSKENNTSVITATLRITATGATYNGYSRSGYITIDGTKYSFSSSFKQSSTTTLATKSKTVKHNSSGGGSITVKGYYSTDTSAGNLSISKSYTLKTIERSYTVSYRSNGGSGAPSSQTKTYGKTLTLSKTTPTRTGYTFVKWNTKSDGSGTSYKSGASYTKNSDVVLYAIWSEITANLICNSFKTDSSTIAITMKYTTSTYLPGAKINNGYHISGWQKKSTGTIYSPSALYKSANRVPVAATLDAVEDVNTSIISFKDINGNLLLTKTYEFGETNVRWPSDIAPEIENKKFLGWTCTPLNSGSLLSISKTWNLNFPRTATAVPYDFIATYGDIDKVSVYYESLNNSLEWDDAVTIMTNINQSYTIPSKTSMESYIRSVGNYKFSGWWMINEIPNNRNHELDNLPSMVFPYNFEPEFDENHYCSEYGLVEEGYIIQNMPVDITIYPIYKDMSSQSAITASQKTFEYVDQRTTTTQYLAYLLGQTVDFNRYLKGEYFVAAHILRSSVKNLRLDISNIRATINTEPVQNLDSNDFITSSVQTDAGTTIYLICKNRNAIQDINRTNIIHIDEGSVLDSVGKVVSFEDLIVQPPDIIRDINKKGDVIAFFGGASDTEKYTSSDHEIVVYGGIYSEDSIHTDQVTITSDINLVPEDTGTGIIDQMVARLIDAGIPLSDLETSDGNISLVKIITKLVDI